MAREPPVTIPVPLTARQRAQLFSQLATMERAGILPARAFSMIGRDLPADMRHALAQTAEALAKGADLAKAGQTGGALLPWEARLVRAARQGKQVFYAGADAHVRRVIQDMVTHLAEPDDAHGDQEEENEP